jgi:hypothetical protein
MPLLNNGIKRSRCDALRVHLASPSSGGQGDVASTSKPDESGAKL